MNDFWIYLLFVAFAIGAVVIDIWIDREDAENDTFDGADPDYSCCFTCDNWEMPIYFQHDPKGLCEVKSSKEILIYTEWNEDCDKYTALKKGDTTDEHDSDALL